MDARRDASAAYVDAYDRNAITALARGTRNDRISPLTGTRSESLAPHVASLPVTSAPPSLTCSVASTAGAVSLQREACLATDGTCTSTTTSRSRSLLTIAIRQSLCRRAT